MKTLHLHIKTAAVGAALALATFVAPAQTFKFANQGDALSMDPHSLNESFQLAFTGNVYESLILGVEWLEVTSLPRTTSGSTT